MSKQRIKPFSWRLLHIHYKLISKIKLMSRKGGKKKKLPYQIQKLQVSMESHFFSHMIEISFWIESPHMLASQQIILRFRVAMTGWRCWHPLGLARSLVVAEGQFWWSLGRQNGIVGRVEGGRAQNTPD